MSRIPSQDATMDLAHSSLSSAEAKQPTQISDETSDTEWPERPCMNEGKAPITLRKRHTMTKLEQQHLPSREFEEDRSQRSFDFVQTVCQTENSEKIGLVEMSGNLIDSVDSKAHSSSEDFKLAASIIKQVREELPTTSPEFESKASKEENHAQQISLNGLIYHLILKPRFCN